MVPAYHLWTGIVSWRPGQFTLVCGLAYDSVPAHGKQKQFLSSEYWISHQGHQDPLGHPSPTLNVSSSPAPESTVNVDIDTITKNAPPTQSAARARPWQYLLLLSNNSGIL